MDFAYTPHRETGGIMHLPSPTHPHSYRLETLSPIQQLRRSLSRSPSKPSRFQLRTRTTDSPGSPLALSRAFITRAPIDLSPVANSQQSPSSTPQAPPPKKKFNLRRTAPFRSSPRTRTNSKSPRRVLAESSGNANASPFFAVRRTSDEENTPRKPSFEEMVNGSMEHKSTDKPSRRDRPVTMDFARSRTDSSAPGANCLLPAKSSPLKRSDGVMNLDTKSVTSPVAKRRSLHGATSFGTDFENIFDNIATPRTSTDDPQQPSDTDIGLGYSFSSPAVSTQSPLRKTSSLRKSTLSQRHGSGVARAKPTGEFAIPSHPASRNSNRHSLDGSSLFGFNAPQSTPVRKPTPFAMPSLRGGVGQQQPHPLSNTLTPSSSRSSTVDESPSHTPFGTPGILAYAPPPAAPRIHAFSKSLPVGATRPRAETDVHGSMETPNKWAPPAPEAVVFLSTGLVSKKRNVNLQEPADEMEPPHMPDTPSKRFSFPPSGATTPTFARRSIFEIPPRPEPESGSPSTPSIFNTSLNSTTSLGRGGKLFGDFSTSHQRRGSFVSIDGDENSVSPSGNHMTDSQSSNEDMPPTPTKQSDGRRSKENSLRRNAMRGRVSLASDTFAPIGTPSIDIPPAAEKTTTSLFGSSPHTPLDSFAPPDPSRLSISGNRRNSIPFPPATPTTPRDVNYFGMSHGAMTPIVGGNQKDIDQSLKGRFVHQSILGKGEFSVVYQVSQPIGQQVSFAGTPNNQVWAIKKAKKPIVGRLDRDKRLREVAMLQELRGNEHILSFTDHWIEHHYLYIQTEYCENGNLQDFLDQAGIKGRLDDFRIWKILLELSMGVKYMHDNDIIHLDLKPANVLIDWEGVLKIADFGMACKLPVPDDIDHEGDRHYLAPEALTGRVGKATDIYVLGMIMLEIAMNAQLPPNGEHWRRYRSGDFSGLPSLTWSSDSSLNRDSHGDIIDDDAASLNANGSTETICMSEPGDDRPKFVRISSFKSQPAGFLEEPPIFMRDQADEDALDRLVYSMMHPDPHQRPYIDQVYYSRGCQWVEHRRRSGATVFEGNWGPSDEVLYHDVEAMDMMDTS
ncbi:kinase-like protein [Polyplosphaeria fusca]|uniref:Kinase-like protein n=1 Tax=Polyplosphaeria fusca TaxID=682080 RepID=A0A9P4R0C4_9PLEO|nr:kinase-like protein [Polyplosphaeria fusca]